MLYVNIKKTYSDNQDHANDELVIQWAEHSVVLHQVSEGSVHHCVGELNFLSAHSLQLEVNITCFPERRPLQEGPRDEAVNVPASLTVFLRTLRHQGSLGR